MIITATFMEFEHLNDMISCAVSDLYVAIKGLLHLLTLCFAIIKY